MNLIDAAKELYLNLAAWGMIISVPLAVVAALVWLVSWRRQRARFCVWSRSFGAFGFTKWDASCGYSQEAEGGELGLSACPQCGRQIKRSAFGLSR